MPKFKLFAILFTLMAFLLSANLGFSSPQTLVVDNEAPVQSLIVKSDDKDDDDKDDDDHEENK